MAFQDSLILLVNSSDPTKLLRFDLSNQPTATTRVIQFPLGDAIAGIAVGRGLFGDGSDGDVTIPASPSYRRLIRDMYYNNLTITNGTFDLAQHRLFVKGTLTIGVGANLTCRYGVGGDASGAGGATGGTGEIRSGGTMGQITGGSGTDGASGVQGVGVQSADPPAVYHAGGGGGYGGMGGTSANGNAGGARSVRNNSYPWMKRNLDMELTTIDAISANRAAVRVAGGLGGRGGSSGGGETGALNGGGGGGAGAGGGVMLIFAKAIVNNGTISNNGGQGGIGGPEIPL